MPPVVGQETATSPGDKTDASNVLARPKRRQNFRAAVQQRDEITYVKLTGVIDEDNELYALVEELHPGLIVVNLADIERINSEGVRDWIMWIEDVEEMGGAVVLVECPRAIVAQVNTVNHFLGSGVVKSFLAPYYCVDCDCEKVLLLETKDMGPPPYKAPTCCCDCCSGDMDFDEMEESYFAFLSAAKKLGA